ncbi:carotenoid biosynthesis protein [Actinomadura luteofluorescens]|uniref:carotenoid biosynthesis protein n=1 Tax=Actinomadura luteofluorescens TaxID=46163 RepID=UPI0021649660|nr:carotenoid biosynthesis protein [Actinomadura glauciflava]MCR3743916.1 putative membrane protein [Actinomadura glauciflava]
MRLGWDAPAPRPLGLLGAGLLAAMVAAQVASGLRPEPIRLTSVVVVLLAASAVAFLADRRSPGRAAGAFAATVAIGYAAEWVGIRTGMPFGEYSYTSVLRPQAGGVPVIVAAAWGGMGLAAHAVATAIAPRNRVARWAAGAAALTAWDLFLDPQMLRLGLWTWADEGPYRGVPLSNFAGWLAVSFLVMLAIDLIAGREDTGREDAALPSWRKGPSRGLVTLYSVMAGMETVAFAAVFEPRDPLVAAAGGVAMGAFAVPAWRRAWRK